MATSRRSRTRSATAGVTLHPPAPSAAAIDDILADLKEKQAQINALIAATDPDDTPTIIRLFGLYGQTASRMGRLLRDQRALSGQAADGIAGAIAQALDELGNELGVNV